MGWLELKIPPVAVWLIAAALVWLLDAATPGLRPAASPLWIAAAGLLALTGAAAGIVGVLAFRAAQTTVHPMHPEQTSRMVTDGIYRWSRNPMYLGLALLLAALVLWWRAPAGLLVLAGFVVYMNRFQIMPEERALAAKFGAEFDRYAAKVRRWL
ncbi:MAG TPA: isoprenylcysteine carboxylmethyltransferase family protein [Beijerinckiaceae bacterium]|nr:isoprenylcysteine carboxylmethyltransferase family protein [Beijerinckiaceae bacterium]